MLLWDGACHVHSQFSVGSLIDMKKQYPDAAVLAHPECKEVILKLADVIGSTAALLSYAKKSEKQQFIVVTESGILHEMQKSCPDKVFIPALPEAIDGKTTCSCNECNYMRLNTLEKVYNCLRYEYPQIEVDAEIAAKAIKPIERMLQLSDKLVK
jgi:quinolinate synthase